MKPTEPRDRPTECALTGYWACFFFAGGGGSFTLIWAISSGVNMLPAIGPGFLTSSNLLGAGGLTGMTKISSPRLCLDAPALSYQRLPREFVADRHQSREVVGGVAEDLRLVELLVVPVGQFRHARPS